MAAGRRLRMLFGDMDLYSLGLQPYPQKVVRPPWHPPQRSSQVVLGALDTSRLTILKRQNESFEESNSHFWTSRHEPQLIELVRLNG